MTEADLDILLNRAGRRLRMERAVRRALLAFGVCLLAAAAVVLWVRLAAAPFRTAEGGCATSRIITAAIIAPPICALIFLLLAYWQYRPAMRYVAYLLDRRAGIKEHLVTWHELRQIPDAALNELQRGFRAAQRACTLQRADGFSVRRLIPIRLPDWSRSLGLALLLLCCALLTPPQAAAPAGSASPGSEAAGRQATRWTSARLSEMAQGTEQTPRVQVLSPTDNKMICLELTDPDKSLEEKAEIVKKLEAKLGGLPPSALSPELQQAYEALRQELDKKNAAQAKTAPSSAQTVGAANPAEKNPINTNEGAAKIENLRVKAFSAIRQNYTDVQEQLERYYKAVASRQ